MSTTPTTLPEVSQSDQELQAMRDQMAKQQKKHERDIESLKKLVMAPPRQEQAQPQAQPAPATYNKDELKKEFFNNPLEVTTSIADAVAKRAVYESNKQVVGSSYDTLKATAKNLVRQRKPEMFDKYESEVEQQVNLLDAQYHTNSNVWQTAFNNVLGQHVDDFVAQAKQENENRAPAVHITKEGGPGHTGARPPAKPAEVLSDDEKYYARKLGVSEASYAQGKKDYDGQPKLQGRKATDPSPWDRVITFNTRDKRRAERERKAATASK